MVDLKQNQKYTLISISEMLANTTKTEITINELREENIFVFTPKNKRTKYILNLDNKKLKNTLIFEGWNIPLKLDSEVLIDNGTATIKRFSGNALINFVGNENELRQFIDNNNLNKEIDKGLIVFETCEDHNKDLENKKPLYLEIATETALNHYPLRNMLKKEVEK